MKKILIQLIGGQTLPNIFSMLSVVPDEVVNIYTEATRKQHEAIMNWCAKFGKDFGLRPVFREYPPVSRDFKTLANQLRETLCHEVERAGSSGDTQLILNMTGATKPMSALSMSICQGLEHHLRAQGKEIRIPIFYVDTQAKTFDFFAHAEMRESLLVHAPFERRLSVRQMTEAGGEARVARHQADWEAVYPAAQLLRECCPHFKPVDITEKNAQEMVQLPLEELVQQEHREKARQFVQKALQDPAVVRGLRLCGYELRGSSFYMVDTLREKANRMAGLQGRENRDKRLALLSDIQTTQNFLIGGWWEVLVAHAYSRRNPGSEVLWSVETISGNNKVETDIVASDGFSLTCISCKRGMHKQVTQELEQHCTRTEILGGVLNTRIIAVYYPKDASAMKGMAKALRMTVWDKRTVDAIESNTPIPAIPDPPERKLEEEQETPERKAPSQEDGTAAHGPESAPLPFGQRIMAAFRILVKGKA